MPHLIRISCPRRARTYRYSSDAEDLETLCPFADCALIEDEDDESDRA